MCSITHKSQEQQPFFFQILGWSLWKMEVKSWVAKSTYRVEVEGQLTFKGAGASILHMDSGHPGDITKVPYERDVVLKMGWGSLPEEDIPLVKGSLVHQVVGIVCAGKWVIHRLALHNYWGVIGDNGVVEVINRVLKLQMARQRQLAGLSLWGIKNNFTFWNTKTLSGDKTPSPRKHVSVALHMLCCLCICLTIYLFCANGWPTHRLTSVSLRVFCP